MWFKLEAMDTLFFRDGKPFSMGEDTIATSLFPPNPSTVYGSLLSAHFMEHNLAFNTNNIDTYRKNVHLRHLQPAIVTSSVQRLFPIPLDLVQAKENKSSSHTEARLLRLQKRADISCNAITSHLLWTEESSEPIYAGWLREKDFKDYLLGIDRTYPILNTNDIRCIEPKIGIARDLVSRTAKEGRIYRVGLNRLATSKGEKVALLANLVQEKQGSVNIGSINPKGLIRMGGDGKGVSCNSIDLPTLSGGLVQSSAILKLYMMTPGLFLDGFLPFQQNGTQSSKRIFNGIKMEIIAYACGRPQMIGGWDLKAQRPKPMLKAVPAGSVYYIRLEDQDQANLFYKLVHEQSISDLKSNEGFGVAMLMDCKSQL